MEDNGQKQKNDRNIGDVVKDVDDGGSRRLSRFGSE